MEANAASTAIKKIIFNIVPHAPYLALAGDIGNPFKPSYAHFLEAMGQKFECVFVIAGTHEFHGNSVPETHNRIRATCDLLPNVHYLNAELFVDDSLPVHVFGGTMWAVGRSAVEDEERSAVEMSLKIRGFVDTKTWHEEFVERLGAALDFHTDKPFLVISHHLPSYGLIHSDCSINPNIKAWIYGHTHKARTGPRFFCNPLGYPGENTHLNAVGSVTLKI